MNDAELTTALIVALTGQRVDDAGGDLPAALAQIGWDRAAVVSHARAVLAGGGVWPHPVPDELRLSLGSARLLAGIQRAQAELGLFGESAAPPVARRLNADERRLLGEVPPHHGS